MKQFAVELKRTSYVTIYVDAETKDQAESLAWDELNGDESYGVSDDANWECADIYEQFATDETRSNGPYCALINWSN
jgi:hypothetical protein